MWPVFVVFLKVYIYIYILTIYIYIYSLISLLEDVRSYIVGSELVNSLSDSLVYLFSECNLLCCVILSWTYIAVEMEPVT